MDDERFDSEEFKYLCSKISDNEIMAISCRELVEVIGLYERAVGILSSEENRNAENDSFLECSRVVLDRFYEEANRRDNLL